MNELNIPKPKALQILYSIEVADMILADKAFALNDYTMKLGEGIPDEDSFNKSLTTGCLELAEHLKMLLRF